MEPVFTVHALYHKVELHLFVVLVTSQVTVTVNVEESLVVSVFCIFIVFICLKLATKRLTRVSTVTLKRSLAVKFINFMSIVAYQHTRKTETVRLYFSRKILLTQI